MDANLTIPKKIHYCWFGGKPLPKSAIKCINSWKKYFPGYEIFEWNESNYDIGKIPYTKQAYQMKKYAFVSDYARFDILYHYGGLYFDTDVEVIKSFDDILSHGAFMGCERDGSVCLQAEVCDNREDTLSVLTNPGLGIAAAPGLRLYKEILEYYQTQHFIHSDGSINTETVVSKTTKILKGHGLQNITGIQEVEGIRIYPKEYFNPLNNNTGELNITENTHSIHWYMKSWLPLSQKIRSFLSRPLHRVFGEDIFTPEGVKK